MLRVVAVINQKGGVGKTTTTANLAHALASAGVKVTVFDLDPQGHLAVSLGVFENPPGLDQVLLENKTLASQLLQVRENLQLLPSGARLREVEDITQGGAQRGDLLRQAIQDNMQDQDFVLFDCPPSSGLLIANALFAADEVLIPMTSDFLALQGLSHLMATLKKFEKVLQKKFQKWLVMSRYCTPRRISKEVLATLLQHFPNQVLATVIRETAMLAECPSHGKTIIEYRSGSRSARDFRNLAKNFMEGTVM